MITATTWFHNFYRYTILTSFSTSTRDGRMGIALVSARDNRMRVALITDINYNCFQMSISLSPRCWSCSWAWTSMCAYCCLHLSLRPLLLDFWCWTCLFSILTLLLVHMVTLADDRDAHAYSCGCVCATYLVLDDDDNNHSDNDRDVHAYSCGVCVYTIVLEGHWQQTTNPPTLWVMTGIHHMCGCFPRRAAEIPSVSWGNGVLPGKENDHSKVESGFEIANLTKSTFPYARDRSL